MCGADTGVNTGGLIQVLYSPKTLKYRTNLFDGFNRLFFHCGMNTFTIRRSSADAS